LSAELELAERALGAAKGETHVSVIAERSLVMRFARSQPTQATAVEDMTVRITSVRDGQIGSSTTNRDDDEALRNCALQAQAIAEAAARSRGPGRYPGFPEPEPLPVAPHHGFDPATARLDPADGGAALAAAFEVARGAGLEAHGVWNCGVVHTALASTKGLAVVDRVTDAFMKVTCIEPDERSGWASRTAVAASELDAAALARTAAAKATGEFAARREVGRLEPGEYPVVLAPAAVGEMLGWLALTAFNGLAHAEGRGALVGRLGHRVAAPAINLSDAPRYPKTLPRAFDAEGVPKRPVPLIQDGVAHRVVHDTRSAAVAGGGAKTTGHALEPGGTTWGPVPTNLVLIGGGAASEEELCEPIERGVYVTRLWYTNVVKAKETMITGVTRDGTFLIEDGRIAAPIDDLRLTDSVLDVLSATEALTADCKLWSEGEFYGRRFATGSVVPALRSASMRFTGGA
jgi:predicted Zn-dependent protease